MIFFLRIPRHVIQELKLKWKIVAIILGVIPVLFILGVFFSDYIKNISTIQQYILSFRFEFTLNPLFILLVGVTNDLRNWEIIRRYTWRKEIAIDEISFVFIYALVFTLVIFLSGAVTYVLSLHQFPKNSPFLINWFSLFYLVFVSIGLLFALIEVRSNKIAASIVMISLVIIDRFSTEFIPFIFSYGSMKDPLSIIIILILFIVFISSIIRQQMKYKQFYCKDENE